MAQDSTGKYILVQGKWNLNATCPTGKFWEKLTSSPEA